MPRKKVLSPVPGTADVFDKHSLCTLFTRRDREGKSRNMRTFPSSDGPRGCECQPKSAGCEMRGHQRRQVLDRCLGKMMLHPPVRPPETQPHTSAHRQHATRQEEWPYPCNPRQSRMRELSLRWKGDPSGWVGTGGKWDSSCRGLSYDCGSVATATATERSPAWPAGTTRVRGRLVLS